MLDAFGHNVVPYQSRRIEFVRSARTLMPAIKMARTMAQQRIFIAMLFWMLLPAWAGAAHRLDVTLDRGAINVAQLQAALRDDSLVPPLPAAAAELLDRDASLSISGPSRIVFIDALARDMGDHCGITLDGDDLVVLFDPDRSITPPSQSPLRNLAARHDPKALADQERHFGLLLPATIDSSRPLVVLLPGMYAARESLSPLADLLTRHGRQVALFGYPGGLSIDDDIARLDNDLTDLLARQPGLRIDLVGCSLGSMIARGWVEGPAYVPSVDHLLMVCPPNHGSSWTTWNAALKLKADVQQFHYDPDFSPWWILSEGVDQSAADLAPGSAFLDELNAQPRRAGVRYAIIAGDQPIQARLAADAVTTASQWLGVHVPGWSVVRQVRDAASDQADDLRRIGGADGPVDVASAKLDGVDDFVLLHADHYSLMYPHDDKPPAAWDAIAQRLCP